MSVDIDFSAKKLNEVTAAVNRVLYGYNELVAGMPNILAQLPTIVTSTGLEYYRLESPSFFNPTALVGNVETAITAAEARTKGYDFTCKFAAKLVKYNNATNENMGSIEVILGRFPVMVLSDLDTPLGTKRPITPKERYKLGEPEIDTGGYFIYGGRELLLQYLEHLSQNNPHLKADKERTLVRYTSKGFVGASTVNIIYEVDGKIYVTFNYINSRLIIPDEKTKMNKSKTNTVEGKKLNIFIMFYCLGITNEDKALKLILSMVSDSRTRKEIAILLEPTLSAYKTMIKIDDSMRRKVMGKKGLSNYQYDDLTMTEKMEIDQVAQITRITQIIKENLEKTVQDDPDYMINFKFHRALIIQNFLPNVAYSIDWEINDQVAAISSKRRTFAYMISKYYMNRLGKQKPTDLDNWGEKMLESPATHIKNKLFELLNRIVNSIQGSVASKNPNHNAIAEEFSRNVTMHDEFSNAFRNNAWKTRGNDSSIVLPLTDPSSNNLLSRHINLARVIVPTSKKTSEKKRLINQSSITVTCFQYTPEGEVCGLVKQLTIAVQISLYRKPSLVYNLFYELLSREMIEGKSNSCFLNGVHVGFCNSTILKKFVDKLRRDNVIPFDIGIVLKDNYEIWIWTTEGRIVIPYYVVDIDRQVPLFRQLMQEGKLREDSPLIDYFYNGAIEYIDVGEQLSPWITIAINEAILDPANNSQYTHMTIDESMILGLGALTVPYAQHSPSARWTYAIGMAKQALGSGFQRPEIRFDQTKVIDYGGVPLVTTSTQTAYGSDRYPSGRNVIVAVMPYGGANQEDGTIWNRDAFERGLFTTNHYHIFEVKLQTHGGSVETFGIPSHHADKAHIYRNLGADGFVEKGAYVTTGDVIIGKTTRKNATDVDSSITMPVNKEGIVDEVLYTESGNTKMVQIRICQKVIPREGDKFTTRISQKGVATKVYRQSDFPIATTDNEKLAPYINGVVPHVIFNPHGYPGRMTLSMPLEHIVGLEGLLKGERRNGTVYRKNEHMQLRENLKKYGFSDEIKVNMIDGFTGKLIKAQISIGSSYYSSLPHFAAIKREGRSIGSIDPVTRRTSRGVRNGGGLQVGPMEGHGIAAHGASYFFYDRLCVNSDNYHFVYCMPCGLPVMPEGNKYYCRTCANKESSQFARVSTSYIVHVLRNYLMIVGIKLKLGVKVSEQC